MHRASSVVAAILCVSLAGARPVSAAGWTAGTAQGPLLPALPDASPLRISQQDFKTLLAQDRPIIIDVRTADAFREGHIPGAVLLAFEGRTSLPPGSDDLVARLKAAKAPIVTYCACRGETTSARVAILLQLHGVQNVRVLTGGWDAWTSQHNAVERAP